MARRPPLAFTLDLSRSMEQRPDKEPLHMTQLITLKQKMVEYHFRKLHSGVVIDAQSEGHFRENCGNVLHFNTA